MIFIFFLLFKYSCLHFSPPLSPAPPTPTTHPQSHPLWLCPWILYMFLDDPIFSLLAKLFFFIM